MARFAIFGSCVTRDAFELAGGNDMRHTVGLYLSRTTINACLAPPVSLPGAGSATKQRFEERCVTDDIRKHHFAKLERSLCHYLIIDLIDERNPLQQVDGSAVCFSVPMSKAAVVNGWNLDPRRRWSPLAPPNVAATLVNLPLFAARIARCFPPRRILIHRALWAPAFRKRDGEIAAFPDQPAIERTNAILRRYYDRLAASLSGCMEIELPADELLADEAHRWTLEPYHYTQPYYAALMRQLDATLTTRQRP